MLTRIIKENRIAVKLRERRGAGEFIMFAFIAICLLSLMLTALGFSQYSTHLNKLNNAMSVVSRVVATSTGLGQAQKDAQAAAENAIYGTAATGASPVSNLTGVNVSVQYYDGSEWKAGTKLLVTLSADIRTVNPFTSGVHTKKSIVSVEQILRGMQRGQMQNTMSANGWVSKGNVIEEYGAKNKARNGYMGGDYTRIATSYGDSMTAPANAVVVHAEENNARYGNWVVMYTGEGQYVEYRNLASLDVEEGDGLSVGQTVGTSGSSVDVGLMYSFDGKDSITDYYGAQRYDASGYIWGY